MCHCVKTITPDTGPECLKLSYMSKSSPNARPSPKKPHLGTPLPASLPRFPCLTLAPQALVVCPRCTWEELAGAPSWPAWESKWLTKGTASETRPFRGNTLTPLQEGQGPNLPGIKAPFQLFRLSSSVTHCLGSRDPGQEPGAARCPR